jgi:hypothetical protein
MYIIMALFIAITYGIFLQLIETLPGLSGIPYAINKALIGSLMLKLIDEFMLYEVETMKILKQDGKAYALYMLAYALIIAFAISGA